MSNNKQSSVEWFYEHLLLYPLPESKEELLKGDWADLYEQAKAMHKKEHGQTWDDAMENMKSRGGNDMRAWADFDDYYEEKFGGIDEQRQGKN